MKKTHIKKISCNSFISLVCYALIGKCVHKITLQSLNNLCMRIKQYYNNNNIIYTKNSLIEYINTFKNSDNYKHVHLFFFINNEIIFKDDTYQVLDNLSSLFTVINKDEFFNLYEHINTFINMYQLIDDIEYKP